MPSLLEASLQARRAFLLLLVLLLLPVLGALQDDSQETEETEEAETEIDTQEEEFDIVEVRRRIFGEAPGEFMSYSIGDANISLFLAGSWMGTLQGNLGFSVSPFGTGFASPETPLLFKQEVDLMLSLWINDRWFVEANFQDDYRLNTYRAGYEGHQGEFLQYAGIGNTGLDFPVFPYLDLGGDSPSSIGFYSRFGTSNLAFHALVRYDAASREERVFSGGRERTFSDISPNDFARGISFVLPDKEITSEIIVYIEDEKGAIADSSRRRWRHALSSEFAVSGLHGLLELRINPQGMIAVSYQKNGPVPWQNSLGTYSGDPYTEFLADVQKWFDSTPTREKIKLEDYIQCGGSGIPGEVILNGITALVIYEPGTFSPFERLNRYYAPSNTSERAALVQISSGSAIRGFELVQMEGSASLEIPLFPEAASQRGIYELIKAGNSSSRHFESRWPLAKDYPELYLPPENVFPGDIALRFTNFNSLGGFFIGTDVIPGSVQVWRSGIPDSNFSYNATSGEVTVSAAAGENELIRITYLKISDGVQFGSITAGLGAIYNNNANTFSVRGAVGVRWNLNNDSFTEENMINEGTVGISAKAAWDYDYLKAHAAAGFTFVQTDTTGLYRAAGMEGHETILSLAPDSSFISNGNIINTALSPEELNPISRAPLIYRNYRNTNAFESGYLNISPDAPYVSGLSGPYPARDRELAGAQVLVAEFELNDTNYWTGFQVPLGINQEILSRATEIEIPFRLFNFKGDPIDDTNFELIIQIGSLSGSDFSFVENPLLIWEKPLYLYLPGDIPDRARNPRFSLDDIDRSKLGDAKFLRIIAVYRGSAAISGRILLAPPIVRGSTFRAVTEEGGVISGTAVKSVTVSETRENQLTAGTHLEDDFYNVINKLHHSMNTQRVMRIEWKDLETGVSAGADGRVGEIPLRDYREISFFVKGPQSLSAINGNLLFYIAPGPESLFNYHLKAEIPLNMLDPIRWSKVTIRYQGGNTGITVTGSSGNAVNAGTPDYRPQALSFGDSGGGSGYIAIIIDSSDPAGPDGILYIDEIILEDPIMVYRINAGAGIEYSRPGTILAIGNFPVLADFSVYSIVESEMRAETGAQNSGVSGSMNNRTGIGISLFGFNIAGNLSFIAAKDTFLWSADHSVSGTFGLFTIGEKFFASPYMQTARHGFNIAFLSDFHISFDADAFYDFSRLRQRWSLRLGYSSINEKIPVISFNTEVLWTRPGEIEENESYPRLWVRSWGSLIPDLGKDADTRRTITQFRITQRTRPFGAVLSLEGRTGFTGANSTTQSEYSAFLDIPLVFDKFNLHLRTGRGFKRHIYFHGNDVIDDTRKFFEGVNDSFALWGVVPFYSLFAPKLNEAMDKTIERSPSRGNDFLTSFNDHLSARLSLPALYNIWSFFVPSMFSFRIDRLIEQRMDNRYDGLNLSGAFGFSAINMFGAMGHLPVFKFYQSDEFSHSINAAVNIPRGEDVSWRIQSVISAGFRGFNGSTLNFVNMFNYRSSGHWTESFIFGWEAPTRRSLLSIFYNWAAGGLGRQNAIPGLASLFRADYEQLRRETLELTFDKQSDYLRWSIAAGHEEIIRVLGRLNFSTFIKLRLQNDLRTKNFVFDVMLGTTIRIIF